MTMETIHLMDLPDNVAVSLDDDFRDYVFRYEIKEDRK